MVESAGAVESVEAVLSAGAVDESVVAVLSAGAEVVSD